MRFNRDRYVTICQQFLVTAAVVAVGASAAGVMTLQIVAPESRNPDAGAQATDLAPAVQVSDGYVATHAVTPKVREVKVPALKLASARTTPGLVLAAQSAPTKVTGYATVGVTWAPGTQVAENAIRVQVRTEKKGAWSPWQTAQYHDEHGPDAGESEGSRPERPGTDADVIGD